MMIKDKLMIMDKLESMQAITAIDLGPSKAEESPVYSHAITTSGRERAAYCRISARQSNFLRYRMVH